jgi:F-type H+-transporting ATPase subunit b
MIHLDISIFYQVILFVALWVILDKLLFQPYLHLLDERERKTTGAEHDSSDLEHQGARLKAQYEEKIAQAQAAGYAAKDTIVQDGRQQREKILSQARDEAAGTLERVRNEVASALEQERRLAVAEVSNVAGAMVAKVLGRTVG